MDRVASFRWRTPPPTSVDELLVLYDDGTARLVVRRPRSTSPTIGTYAYKPDRANFVELSKAGAAGITFDLHQAIPAETADLQVLASRIAAEALAKPEATATFYGRAMGAPASGMLSLSLAAVGGGKRSVEFNLDPEKCAIHFMKQGQAAAWVEFPALETGFVTPDAEELGGLGRRAEVPPKAWGALLVKISLPAGVTGVVAQVAGKLYEALPDETTGAPFEVRTDEMEVPAV